MIELIAVISIITMFSLILINDFPKTLRQFAVSRSAYKLSQDIRRAEDLGLSGFIIESPNKPVGGYGLYINKNDVDEYIIYADNFSETPNYQYNSGDSIVETIIISEQQAGVYIKEIKINGEAGGYEEVSINFTPPNPKIIITASDDVEEKNVDIVIGSTFDSSLERTVSVNTSGLIEVK